MTFAQEREWRYRHTERLGILCGTGQPTPEQEALAREDADAWLIADNARMRAEAGGSGYRYGELNELTHD